LPVVVTMIRRTCLLFALMFSCGLFDKPAIAQQLAPLLPLPELKTCRANIHPRLPDSWRGVFLMAPFTNAQLVLSEIEDDSSLTAMRVRLYGLRSGTLDLFIEGTETYELTSQDDEVRACEKLGDTGWRPLSQDWLSPQSQCAGTGLLGTTEVDWWKTPTDPKPSSYWVWYNASDKTPFRLAFQKASNRLAPLSKYALSYQLHFEPTTDSSLGEISRACHNASQSAAEPGGLDRRIAGLSTANGQRASQAIAQVAPELAACPSTPLPSWPDRLAITGLMTPWDSDENPYGTEVFYDWTKQAQRTRTFPYSHGPFRAQDALLLGRRGYNVTYRQQAGPTCETVLPGTLKPDWSLRGSCSCEGMLTGTSALTPYGTTRIFTCPLASPRAAWAWYALDGRPTSFAVTSLPGDQGFGLFAVLDYDQWLPGQQAPPTVFNQPAQCQAHGLRIHADTSKCSSCHLGDVRNQH
jgi:hypothetical protein